MEKTQAPEISPILSRLHHVFSVIETEAFTRWQNAGPKEREEIVSAVAQFEANMIMKEIEKESKKDRDEKGRIIPGSSIGVPTRFTPERSRGNQHAKGNPPNRTSFSPGSTAQEKNRNWKGGVQVMKRDGVYLNVGVGRRMPRGRKVWEDANGPLPKGCVIYHLDGDNRNDDISNLEAITRAEMMRRNSPHY